MSRRILCMLLAVAALCALLPMAAVRVQAAESTYPPYAQVISEYTPEVECGTIRYICQMVDGAEYRYDYWKEWERKRISGVYYGPESECGTSCISMALSYVGVNKTPKDILDYGRGHTHFMDWGGASITNFAASDLKAAMDNYINGEGRYSPPVIHLPNYSERGHFVVVIGRIDEKTYEILDPNNRAVTTMTVTGRTAKYTLRGYSKTDRIDRIHQWYNPNAAPALIQKTYPAACLLKTKMSVSGMSLPCSPERNERSTVLLALDKDQTVSATELVLNDQNEYWYKIGVSGQKTCYIPASAVAYQQEEASQIAISGANNPTRLAKGSGFSIKGKITSGNSRLTSVAVYIRGTDGEPVLSGKAAANSNTYNLSGSSVNSQIRFGKLAEGEYTYTVEAQHINYYVGADNTLCSNEGTVVLHEAVFTVEDLTDRHVPDKPVLEVSNEKGQVQFSWESVAHATHYQLCIYKENAGGEWEELETVGEPASGMTRTLLPGAYRMHLIAYNKNAQDAQTPADEVQLVIECEHVYGMGTYTKMATCQETGILSYLCSVCGETKEEEVPQQVFHTPGPVATATTDQTCTVCGLVLKAALGETEPTEPSEPKEQPEAVEPAGDGWKIWGNVFAISAAVTLSAAAVAVLWKKEHAKQESQEEVKETQS